MNFEIGRWRGNILSLAALKSAFIVGSLVFSGAAFSAPIITITDDNGADDEPGQKDLNQLTVDYNPGVGDIAVTWNWDETGTNGNNSLDACSLYDTNGDGLADASLCVIGKGDPSEYQSTVLYTCNNTRADRCAGPTEVAADSDGDGDLEAILGGPYGSTCDTAIAASDPFHAGENDNVASCTVVLADIGDNATLTNVCSYPSQQPNSDPSDCVIAPNSGFLTVEKVADPDDKTITFTVTSNLAANDGDSSWSVDGSGNFVSLETFETENGEVLISLTENVPAGWQLDSVMCEIQSQNSESTGSVSGSEITDVKIRAGLETVCTFTNSLEMGTLTLTKIVDNLGETGPEYLAIGDFELTIDGVSTESGVVNDVVAGQYDIAEGAEMGYQPGSWSCDNGSVGPFDSTLVTVAGGVDVVCEITNTLIAVPNLSITKVATPQTYSAVGEVINYSIVAKNEGNVTLSSVTVSDGAVSDLSCTPANGSSLAPDATLVCTATHTITQADIDGGSYANTACVDDGAGGADEKCADEEVTADPDPKLSITKAADILEFTALGQVINYTIVATNVGNVTIASATVTDTAVSNLSCVPANGSTLAPGDSLNCTASHTVNEMDGINGLFKNTACVDDGVAGAEQVCADAAVPGNLPEPPQDDPYPARTIGYWKTHPASVTAILDGAVPMEEFSICGRLVTNFCDAYELLNKRGGGLNNFLRQATAAKLNCLASTQGTGDEWGCDPAIEAIVDDASCPIGQASNLDDYNNGQGIWDGISVDGLANPLMHGRAVRRVNCN